jgi:predicted metalloprotease with PDZ domain
MSTYLWPSFYRAILNYCRAFRGLWFSNRKQQNKTAYEIWKRNSIKPSMWRIQCCQIKTFWAKFSYLISSFISKNAVSWVVAPCSSCVNRSFGGSYRFYLQGKRICERGTSVSNHLFTLVIKLTEHVWKIYTNLTRKTNSKEQRGQQTDELTDSTPILEHNLSQAYV